MDSFKTVEIIDTKVVNNITYKLVKRVENGIKMKLWIPEYLVNKETNTFASAMKSVNLTQDEKVYHLYNQLKKFSADEVDNLQTQVILLIINMAHTMYTHKSQLLSEIARLT